MKGLASTRPRLPKATLGPDVLMGAISAVVFFNEYLSMASSATPAKLAAGVPNWVSLTSLRCVAAVMVAVFIAQLLSQVPKHLAGPRATPMLVYGWLLSVGWNYTSVHTLGLQGVVLLGACLVLMAGLVQLLVAALRWGSRVSSLLAQLVVGGTLFAGGVSMISSEIQRLASCATEGNWRGLGVAALVVGCSLGFKHWTEKGPPQRKRWSPASMLVGLAVGWLAYVLCLRFMPHPGLCRTLGSVTLEQAGLVQWPPAGHLLGLLQEPAWLLTVVLGGAGLGIVCMADTLGALNSFKAQETPINMDRELGVSGLSTLLCGALCLPPVAISFSRSQMLQVQSKLGRRAPLFHGLTLAVILAFALPGVAELPRAVLAGCVVLVALDMLTGVLTDLLRWTLQTQRPQPVLGRALLLLLLVVCVGLLLHNSVYGLLAGAVLSWIGLGLHRQPRHWRLSWREGELHLRLTGAWGFQATPALLAGISQAVQSVRADLPVRGWQVHLDQVSHLDFQAAHQLHAALKRWNPQQHPVTVSSTATPESVTALLRERLQA
ncbi:SulP family inorganic anion transporter [Curvibacter sp. RS43]|uniref:SulP family inorganic anion transporter n=1 Tax=Curvibacter microcysteis TaxID=3026419 RepID=UPI00236210C2|nr:SulP family inorganic anion transporter [Curvibacter sp. RS43]MDD0809470.1 SulP family inorganic anion transporter [Curvibacter sp. RS43]